MKQFKEEQIDNDDVDIDDDDDENLSQFLFDAYEPTRTSILEFVPSHSSILHIYQEMDSTIKSQTTSHHPTQQQNGDNKEDDISHPYMIIPPMEISAVIQAIDDYPGAKQSGLYLWPAGPALAQFLVDSFFYGIRMTSHTTSTTMDIIAQQRIQMLWSSILYNHTWITNHTSSSKPRLHIIELGAGCGLGGIVAYETLTYLLSYLQNQTTHITLTFTDHDHNTLTRAQTNLKSSLELCSKSYNNSMSQEEHSILASWISRMNQTQCFFQPLKWGDNQAISHWKKSIHSLYKDEGYGEEGIQQQQQQYQLVLGSDLIYSIHVVRPLFRTAVQFLQAFTTTKDTDRNSSNNNNNNTHQDYQLPHSTTSTDQGIFILAQSFIYDEETEIEIDIVCKELRLSRYILWDDLMKQQVKQKTPCTISMMNDYYSGIRIQVYFLE